MWHSVTLLFLSFGLKKVLFEPRRFSRNQRLETNVWCDASVLKVEWSKNKLWCQEILRRNAVYVKAFTDDKPLFHVTMPDKSTRGVDGFKGLDPDMKINTLWTGCFKFPTTFQATKCCCPLISGWKSPICKHSKASQPPSAEMLSYCLHCILYFPNAGLQGGCAAWGVHTVFPLGSAHGKKYINKQQTDWE